MMPSDIYKVNCGLIVLEMNNFFKILLESANQAFQALRSNPLRTFLSLMGITIGIFCIIVVKSAVDSLQQSIVDGFSELGSDVIYIDKMPWNEPRYKNYWKYAKRPDPSFEDFKAIQNKSKFADFSSFVIFISGKTIKYGASSVSNAFIMGFTYDYNQIVDVDIIKGHYFNQKDYRNGENSIILGYNVAESLFQNIEPIGKKVKLFGQKYTVIGVLKKQGNSLINILPYDDAMWISYPNIKKHYKTNMGSNVGKMLNVKAKPGVDLNDLKDELTGILRSKRKLRPSEENNFSLNELSMITQVLNAVFRVMNIAGFIIGIFALIVGMFSVANIMFVSVKERTNIIGIKKALGAKKKVILTEFLIESVILCLVGGFIGLIFVMAAIKVLSKTTGFVMYLSMSNILIGIGVSIIVGIISGMIPASLAAKMDPVEAMRG